MRPSKWQGLGPQLLVRGRRYPWLKNGLIQNGTKAHLDLGPLSERFGRKKKAEHCLVTVLGAFSAKFLGDFI